MLYTMELSSKEQCNLGMLFSLKKSYCKQIKCLCQIFSEDLTDYADVLNGLNV